MADSTVNIKAVGTGIIAQESNSSRFREHVALRQARLFDFTRDARNNTSYRLWDQTPVDVQQAARDHTASLQQLLSSIDVTLAAQARESTTGSS